MMVYVFVIFFFLASEGCLRILQRTQDLDRSFKITRGGKDGWMPTYAVYSVTLQHLWSSVVSQNVQHGHVDTSVACFLFFSPVISSRNFSLRCSMCGMCSRNAAKIPAVWVNFLDLYYSFFFPPLLHSFLFKPSLLNSLIVRVLIWAACSCFG